MNKKQIEINELYTCSPVAIWAYIRSQSFGFWCVCIYLFFEYVRPQSIYNWLDVLPWAAIFIVLSLIFALLEKDKVAGNPVSKLIGLYGVVVVFSASFAQWPSMAFSNLGAYWSWVLIFFIIVKLINTKERFYIFLLLYLLCNFKMGQHGFISWALKGFSFSSWGVAGAPGWFQNSGEFGIQLTIFIPLAIAFILALKQYWGKWTRYFFYLMPITGIGSVVATSSRGAMLGMVAAGLWQVKSSKYFFRGVVSLAVIASLIYVITPDEFKSRFSSSGEDKTSMHRLHRWEAGWDTALSNPVFGVGHKNWDTYFRNYLDHGQKGSAKIHNIFMESLTEHGFSGLVVLILLLLFMFSLNSLTRRALKGSKDNFGSYIAYGLDAGLIGMIVSSSFVTVLYYPYVWIHAAFVVALYNVTYKSTRQSDFSLE